MNIDKNASVNKLIKVVAKGEIGRIIKSRMARKLGPSILREAGRKLSRTPGLAEGLIKSTKTVTRGGEAAVSAGPRGRYFRNQLKRLASGKKPRAASELRNRARRLAGLKEKWELGT